VKALEALQCWGRWRLWCSRYQSRDSPANHGEDYNGAGISMQLVERKSDRVAGWVAGCWPRLTHHRGTQSPWMRLKTTASFSKEPSEAVDK